MMNHNDEQRNFDREIGLFQRCITRLRESSKYSNNNLMIILIISITNLVMKEAILKSRKENSWLGPSLSPPIWSRSLHQILPSYQLRAIGLVRPKYTCKIYKRRRKIKK